LVSTTPAAHTIERPSASSNHVYEEGDDNPNRFEIWCTYPHDAHEALKTFRLARLYCLHEAGRICPRGYVTREAEFHPGAAEGCFAGPDAGHIHIICRCPAGVASCGGTPTDPPRDISPSKPGPPLMAWEVWGTNAKGWCYGSSFDSEQRNYRQVQCAADEDACTTEVLRARKAQRVVSDCVQLK